MRWEEHIGKRFYIKKGQLKVRRRQKNPGEHGNKGLKGLRKPRDGRKPYLYKVKRCFALSRLVGDQNSSGTAVRI